MGKIGNLQWNPDFSNLYGKVNKLVRENEVRLNGSTIIYIKKKQNERTFVLTYRRLKKCSHKLNCYRSELFSTRRSLPVW